MGKHARDSHSDEDIEIEYRHQDIRQKHNELHESPSTSKSPQSEGESQISVLANQGSTKKTLAFDSLKKNMTLRVNLEVNDGEYNLKLISVPTNNTMTENAHTAAMLLSQGKLLCKIGEKLLSKLGMSYESEIYRSLNLQLPF